MTAWAIRHHRSPYCAPTISTKNRPGAVWDPCAFPVRCVPHSGRIPRPVLCVPHTSKTHEPRYPLVGSLCWSIPVRCGWGPILRVAGGQRPQGIQREDRLRWAHIAICVLCAHETVCINQTGEDRLRWAHIAICVLGAHETMCINQTREDRLRWAHIALCALGTLYDSDSLRWAHDELCCGYPIRHRSGPNKALEAHFLEPTGATEERRSQIFLLSG